VISGCVHSVGQYVRILLKAASYCFKLISQTQICAALRYSGTSISVGL